MESTPNPAFGERDSTTDMCFVVEEETIHFCKALLIVSSPVFARMFGSDFKEKDMATIALPGKSYTDFKVFLMQLHPAHAWLPIKESDVRPLLELADEYDVKHVTKKCTHFIRSQMEFTLTLDTVMKYLWLSETHQLTELQEPLLVLAADHSVEQLEACEYYCQLHVDKQLMLVKTRCRQLEDEKDEWKLSMIQTGRAVRKMKYVVDKLPGLTHSLLECQCCQTGLSQNFCVPCPNHSRPCKPWSCQAWCDCIKDISSLQIRYCKKCVISKTCLIVGKLPSLFEAIKPVQQFISQKCSRIEISL